MGFHESPERRHLRFDPGGPLVGMSMFGVRRDLEAVRNAVVMLTGAVETDESESVSLTTAMSDARTPLSIVKGVAS